MKLCSLRMLMIVGLSLSCAQPMMAMEKELEALGPGEEEELRVRYGMRWVYYKEWVTWPGEKRENPRWKVLTEKSVWAFVDVLKQEITVASQEKQNAVAELERYLMASEEANPADLRDRDDNYLYTVPLLEALKKAYNAGKSVTDQVNDCDLALFKIAWQYPSSEYNDIRVEECRRINRRNELRVNYCLARKEKKSGLKE